MSRAPRTPLLELSTRPAIAILAALLLAMTTPAANAAPSDSTTVVLLGTGMPRPNPQRAGPATAVLVGDRFFLFDAGPCVMRQIAAAHLSIKGPTALFVTHLHSDHTLGYPDLILTSWVMGRDKPFPVVGPPGLKEMTDHLYAAWHEDIAIRTNGLEHDAAGGEKVDVREVSPPAQGVVVYDSAGVRITAFPVRHGDWKVALGYRIDTPERVIVISGDTRPSPELASAARGADLLIHEVYPESHLGPEPGPGGEDWPAYMKSFHTSDVELGRIARDAGVKRLVLTHVVWMGVSEAELIDGVRRGGFTGIVQVGADLGRY